MPIITSVDRSSPAEKAGFRPADELLQLDGHPITDVFDLKFYSYERRITALIRRDGRERTLRVRKREGEPLGLEFESYLIDTPRSCHNKCIFCFIDQMPRGMRETLYFKDDDARLSFLQGNYITLTNLSDEDVARIAKMRISPINVSVHTTNPELRCRMLHNRFAGESLHRLSQLAAADVEMNAQIVLCPGWNDGDELRRTLADLSALGEALLSVSVVPVGLTRYREGLEPLRPVTREDAREVISILDEAAERQLATRGSRVFYASDEFYLKAELPLPDMDYYEDFPQLENGVGMLALCWDEFLGALEAVEPDSVTAREVSLATGMLFLPELCKMVDLLEKKCHNVHCNVYGIVNDFFGPEITVAGLVTGGDLIRQLRGKPLGSRLIVPRTMLRAGDNVFLDDVTTDDAASALGVAVTPCESDGAGLLQCILTQ